MVTTRSRSYLAIPILLFTMGSAAGGDSVRTVAHSMGALNAPQIDAQGRTAFHSPAPQRLVANEDIGANQFAEAVSLDAMPHGLYVERQVGHLDLVVSASNPPPGVGDGIAYGSVTTFQLNPRGDIAFRATLIGDGITNLNNDALFAVNSEGVTRLVFRENQELPLPGMEGGTANFRFVGGVPMLLNAAGRVTLAGELTPPGASATRILQEQAGGIAVLDNTLTVQTTTKATREDPSLPTTLVVTTTDLVMSGVGANGEVVFRAALIPPPNNGTNFQATNAIVRQGPGGEFEAVVLQGQVIEGATISNLYRPVINGVGDVASVVQIAGSPAKRSIVRASAGEFRIPVKVGDIALHTEAGTTIAGINDVLKLNNQGDLLLRTVLAGPGISTSNNIAIYIDRPGTGLSPLVRSGDQAPGTEVGTVFSPPEITQATINNAGQGAFYARLLNSTFDRDAGIWAHDRQGNLQLIVREGDTLDISGDGEPADLKTVEFLSLLTDNGSRGTPSGTGFNDRGQIAFAARFTDGTSGIFVSNAVAIPEPATVAILLLGFAAVIGLRNSSHRN